MAGPGIDECEGTWRAYLTRDSGAGLGRGALMRIAALVASLAQGLLLLGVLRAQTPFTYWGLAVVMTPLMAPLAAGALLAGAALRWEQARGRCPCSELAVTAMQPREYLAAMTEVPLSDLRVALWINGTVLAVLIFLHQLVVDPPSVLTAVGLALHGGLVVFALLLQGGAVMAAGMGALLVGLRAVLHSPGGSNATIEAMRSWAGVLAPQAALILALCLPVALRPILLDVVPPALGGAVELTAVAALTALVVLPYLVFPLAWLERVEREREALLASTSQWWFGDPSPPKGRLARPAAHPPRGD